MSSRKRKIVAKPVLRVEVLDNNGEIETNFNIDLMQNMANMNPAAMIGDSICAITDVRDASEPEAVLDESEHCCSGSSSCICFYKLCNVLRKICYPVPFGNITTG